MMDYRKDPRLNASLLKLYSGKDFNPLIATHRSRNQSEPSDSMLLGTLVHGILELCGDIPGWCKVSPYDSYRTKEAKEWKQTQVDAGNIIYKAQDLDKAIAMANRVLTCTPQPVWSYINATSSLREVEYYTDTEKALLDLVTSDQKIGLDYKTTRATSMAQFQRDAVNFGYALQAYHYVKVSGVREFWFVGVSTTDPHPVFAMQCDAFFLDFGRFQWEEAFARWELYKDMDPSSIEAETGTLTAPKWFGEQQPEEDEGDW